jgi:hypothetical protein
MIFKSELELEGLQSFSVFTYNLNYCVSILSLYGYSTSLIDYKIIVIVIDNSFVEQVEEPAICFPL